MTIKLKIHTNILFNATDNIYNREVILNSLKVLTMDIIPPFLKAEIISGKSNVKLEIYKNILFNTSDKMYNGDVVLNHLSVLIMDMISS